MVSMAVVGAILLNFLVGIATLVPANISYNGAETNLFLEEFTLCRRNRGLA